METQKVEIEVPVFEGYEFDRIGRVVLEGECVCVLSGDWLSDPQVGNYFYIAERLIYRKKVPYKFWLPNCGMPKPSRVPEDLEGLLGSSQWATTRNNPNSWEDTVYRWREDVPMEDS